MNKKQIGVIRVKQDRVNAYSVTFWRCSSGEWRAGPSKEPRRYTVGCKAIRRLFNTFNSDELLLAPIADLDHRGMITLEYYLA